MDTFDLKFMVTQLGSSLIVLVMNNINIDLYKALKDANLHNLKRLTYSNTND